MKQRKFYGNRLRAIRYFNGLTMSDIGDKLGISKQALSKYEKGQMKPSYTVEVGMCSILNVPADFFTRKSITIKMVADNVKCDLFK